MNGFDLFNSTLSKLLQHYVPLLLEHPLRSPLALDLNPRLLIHWVLEVSTLLVVPQQVLHTHALLLLLILLTLLRDDPLVVLT